MQNNLQVFQNRQFGQMRGYISNNTVYLNLGDVAQGLVFIKNDGKIRSRTINRLLKKAGYTKKFNANDYAPESVLYFLAMRTDDPNAEDFQKWLACDVVPTIRKTGSYSVNSVVNNVPALPAADIRKKSLATTKRLQSIIQRYTFYAYKQGDRRGRGNTFNDYSSYIFKNFMRLSNSVADIQCGHRANSDSEKQFRLKTVETFIGNMLLKGMSRGEHFPQIESEIICEASKLASFFKTNLPFLEI